MFVADGGNSVRNILEPVGEPFRPEMQMYSVAKELGTHGMWQLQIERTDLSKAYLDRWNRCEGLDAILCISESHSLTTCLSRLLTYRQVRPLLTHPSSMRTSGMLATPESSMSSTIQLCRSHQA